MVRNTEVKELGHFINGKIVAGKSGHFLDVYNLSTGIVMAKVPLATKEEVQEAISAAQRAFPAWCALSADKRTEIIVRFRQILTDRMDAFVNMICTESGKTTEVAKGEITRGLEFMDLAINAPHLLKGVQCVNVGDHIKEPLGVVAAIYPFNFPVMVRLAITSMAIAVGNCVMLKPSEHVPCSALFLSELWKEAGLPDGVWTVINGDKETVHELLADPAIQAISFVGSIPVADVIYTIGSKYDKPALGNFNRVDLPDTDLKPATHASLGAAYGATFQRCMAISTFMPVGEGTANKLVQILIEKISALKVGPYTDSVVDFGLVISQQARDTIIGYINVEKGATIVVGNGYNPAILKSSNGFYRGPTLNMKPGMEIYLQEVFGSARNIVRIETLGEAIAFIKTISEKWLEQDNESASSFAFPSNH